MPVRAGNVDRLYSYFGFGVITLAGLYLAAVAHDVTRFDAWLAAYLILVFGVAQIVIGQGISQYHNRPLVRPAVAIFIVYNLANLLVILGRGLEFAPLVFAGTIGIVAAMLLVFILVRGAKFSRQLMLLYVVCAVVLLGSIAGSILTVVL